MSALLGNRWKIDLTDGEEKKERRKPIRARQGDAGSRLGSRGDVLPVWTPWFSWPATGADQPHQLHFWATSSGLSWPHHRSARAFSSLTFFGAV